jgi:hypothetical protein
MFISELEGDRYNNWKKTGAFMIRFTKDGENEIIIVDDFIPLKEDNTPVFTSGGTDGKELWVSILEKAYAKLYCSYSYIEAGKIPLALADMIPDGFGEEIALKDVHDEEIFWKTVKELLSVNAMLGAGSPEHPEGDSACSMDGIVMNHAYAILKIERFEGEILF